MKASGYFEINLVPQTEDSSAAGRMLIDKNYTGDMIGTGLGQMLSKRTDSGQSVYSAIEEFEGSVNGKIGSFTLFHVGKMSANRQSLEINIVSGSGAAELTGIEGQLTITQEQGSHQYLLEYTL